MSEEEVKNIIDQLLSLPDEVLSSVLQALAAKVWADIPAEWETPAEWEVPVEPPVEGELSEEAVNPEELVSKIAF